MAARPLHRYPDLARIEIAYWDVSGVCCVSAAGGGGESVEEVPPASAVQWLRVPAVRCA